MRGKRNSTDVLEFQWNLVGNILALHRELAERSYRHSAYESFNISDPKTRSIHKALVRDRLLHHALHRIFYPFFDRTFIADSYSCRCGRGVHRAINRFRAFAYKASQNHTKTAWVLKCDIRKFFASVDHAVLMKIVSGYISDRDIVRLVSEIVGSFHTAREGVGLPLGNLTSQLFANVYLNEMDQFVKHTLKVKYYIRYADDFALFSGDRGWLERVAPRIRDFLQERLRLSLHPDKLFLRSVASGVEFLGWVHFSDHRVLRRTTTRRMLRRITEAQGEPGTVQSYLGLVSHGNSWKLQQKIRDHASKGGFP